jgi:uncharacterized protein YbjT (DUF2867 family)
MGGFLELHAFQMLGGPIMEKGRVVVPGRGEAPRAWVSVDDAAALAVHALLGRDVAADHDVVTVASQETLSTVEMAELLANALGRELKVTHVPLGVLRAGRGLARVLYPPASRLLEAALLPDEHGEAVDEVAPGPGFVFGRPVGEVVAEWATTVAEHPASG